MLVNLVQKQYSDLEEPHENPDGHFSAGHVYMSLVLYQIFTAGAGLMIAKNGAECIMIDKKNEMLHPVCGTITIVGAGIAADSAIGVLTCGAYAVKHYALGVIKVIRSCCN